MKRKFLFIIITIIFSKSVIAQNNTGSTSQIQTDVQKVFVEIAKDKQVNYYQVLSKTAEYVFADENPAYVKAIEEKIKKENLPEVAALEKLFRDSYAILRDSSVWKSAPEITDSDRKILNVYNETLCPCLSSKYKVENKIEVLLKVQNECLSSMIRDTVFLYKLKTIAGDSTLNSIYRLQRYLFLLMYEKCDVIQQKFDNQVFELSVLDAYYKAISNARRNEIIDVLKYFEQNKTDSLKRIFPAYQKYGGVLKDAVKKKNNKNYKTSTYYYPHFVNSSRSEAVVDIHAADLTGVELRFMYAAHALNARIDSVAVKYFKPTKGEKEGQIIEIKVDEVKPKQ
jgi:hypothetical protein